MYKQKLVNRWRNNLPVDILRIIVSILLIFFIPGFFLIQALFPRRNELDEEYDFLYRIVLGIVLSIVITTFDGFILGSLGVNPATGKGYWDTPFIFGSLIGISIVLFVIGWYRGAYPLLGRRPPDVSPLEIPEKDKEEFYKIMKQWKALHKKLDRNNDMLLDETYDNKNQIKSEIAKITKKLEELESRLLDMGYKEIPIIKAKQVEEKDKK